ncbi:hypothetical protein [Haloarcula sp. JP-L23]|uniref:hypothetical protein n=1 Tax=Haloarcula sp. JP-L23 TaxID=2716717 RepID=UPI00140F2999|nr:hypothetical protein G9465_18345 [Haloarcula sp. JP-L23]
MREGTDIISSMLNTHMDPNTVFERAEVMQQPGDLLPGGSEATTWVVLDPETDCRGVGDFEKAARTNLVYAVDAYHKEPETTVPFLSAGKKQTHEMHWLRTGQTSLTDHLQNLLPPCP